jgi:recombination protein RecT
MSNTKQAIVPASAPKPNTLQSFLEGEKASAKLAAVAKGFMSPTDLTRMALVAVHRNPELLKCTPASVLAALMDAAELKIKPGGMMGRGYLVPRRNKNTKQLECCFDPGWRGLIDIMRRSGEIKRIEAHPVFSNDVLRVEYGLQPVFQHTPCLEENRGQIVAAYALAEFKDGTFQVELLTKADLVKIRAASPSTSGPWATWDDEMARKSAVRRLSKYMPFDALVDKAAHLAAKTEPAGLEGVEWDVDMPPSALEEGDEPKQMVEGSRTEALKQALAKGRSPVRVVQKTEPAPEPPADESDGAPPEDWQPEGREPGEEG